MAVKSEQEITQIGSTVYIKGDISGKSDVRVAGNINGSINIEGELIIEKAGHVEGEIKSVTAVIAGSVKGNIDVSEKLILESSSQYVGNIKTKQLIIQEGAIFQGNCQMGLRNQAAPAAAPSPKEPIKL